MYRIVARQRSRRGYRAQQLRACAGIAGIAGSGQAAGRQWAGLWLGGGVPLCVFCCLVFLVTHSNGPAAVRLKVEPDEVHRRVVLRHRDAAGAAGWVVPGRRGIERPAAAAG